MGKGMQWDKDDIDAILGGAGFSYVTLLAIWKRGRIFVFVDNGYTVIYQDYEEIFSQDLPVDSGEFMEALARAELKG